MRALMADMLQTMYDAPGIGLAANQINVQKRLVVMDISDDKEQNNEEEEFRDEDVVFIHEDYTVTKLMWHNENVIFNQVTPEWRDFCANVIGLKVPDGIDMIASLNSAKNKKQKSS